MEHPNLEVRSRFQDVMVRFVKGKERLKRMKQASNSYLELCRVTGTYLFFVRAIEIRQAKALYDEAFLKQLRDTILDVKLYSVWLPSALNQMKANIDEGLDNKYIKDILSAYTAILPCKYYTGIRLSDVGWYREHG